MSNYICTLYSHEATFDLVTNEAKKLFPDAEWEYERLNEFTNATLVIKGGLFRPKKKLRISYRERDNFSYELNEATCPVSSNLVGMLKMVNSIQTHKKDIQSLLIQKIQTINVEFSLIMVENSEKEFKALVQHLAFVLDAIVFAQPKTGLMNSLSQAFLDKELELILDVNGESNVDGLNINILPKYIDNQEVLAEHQVSRKEKSELAIRDMGIKVNENLPPIASEEKTKLRSKEEISERLISLALTNLVAFNNISGEQAIQYGTKHEMIDLLSPKEINFLKHPTDEAKNHETWKCEGIWTLFWALGIVDDLGSPSILADLTKIPEGSYPVGSTTKPLDFILKAHQVRSLAEVLDANDLYYRLDWACVDARIKGEEVNKVHPGVVYERHYTLNWLINYRNQDWDNVSADT